VLLVLFSTIPAPTALCTLSLHDALPISYRTHPGDRRQGPRPDRGSAREGRDLSGGGVRATRRRRSAEFATARGMGWRGSAVRGRSEEHTSELQSRENLVCRLLLEKKNPR